MSSSQCLESTLAVHLVTTSFEDLPPATIRAAKRSLLDTFGVMLAATALSDDARMIAELARETGGRGESTVLGYGDRLPATATALVNGALCHPLDYDDTHDRAVCHPTAETLPATLALAERAMTVNAATVSGRDLLTAVAIATDLICRMGLSVDSSIPQHGWLPPSVLGHLGAAAGGAKILGFSAEKAANAMAIAFTQAGGSHEMSKGKGSSIRGVRDGFSQQAGVLSCLLADRGLTGPAHFLTGPSGLFNLYFRGQWTVERLTHGLGERFEGEVVSHKPWPSCRLTHFYIEALLTLMHSHDIESGQVETVEAVVDDWARLLCEPADERARPDSDMSAKYSIPFTLGVALAHGSVKVEHFTRAGLGDPDSLAAAAKVRYRLDTTPHPDGKRPGRVTLHLKDGRSVSTAVEEPRGGSAAPLSDDVLAAKFADCAQHAVSPLSSARVDEFVETCMRLDEIDDLADLTRQLS